MKIIIYKASLKKRSRHPILVKDDESEYNAGTVFNRPSIIADMMNSCFGLSDAAEEYVYMICFNTSLNRILGIFEISHGTVDSSMLQPRELFIRAVLCGAVKIIIIHNHPGSECSPSGEDRTVTKRIMKAADIMGIKLLDHIIVCDKGFYSFCENMSFDDLDGGEYKSE